MRARLWRNFQEALQAAISDFVDNGFDSQERLDFWMRELTTAAERFAGSQEAREENMSDALRAIYKRMVEDAGMLRYHPGVSRLTLQHVVPHLRAELDRRIMASANLIRMNREQAVSDTLRRFAGWATSIPIEGTRAEDKRETRAKVGKDIANLDYHARFVANDQGHKFVASLNQVLADQNGAIALRWDSRWRALNYNAREEHKARDGKYYLLRGSWAHKAGLVKRGDNPFYDEIDNVGSLPNCRCSAVYVYALSRLPPEMLTEKGKAKLAEAKEKMNAA